MRLPTLAILCYALGLPACSRRADDSAAMASARAEVIAALERYMIAARAVDPDSIAAAFSPTGTLLEPGIPPIQSPDSIRAFVRAFAGAVVESASALPEVIDVYDTTAYMWGSYFERLTFPGQPRSEQHGRFVIQWRLQSGTWRIERYYRVPGITVVEAGSIPGP